MVQKVRYSESRCIDLTLNEVRTLNIALIPNGNWSTCKASSIRSTAIAMAEPRSSLTDPSTQEESKIGDLDGMPSQHPAKWGGAGSQCQGSRSVLTNFASRRTLHVASQRKICSYFYWYLVVMNLKHYTDVIFMLKNHRELARNS